MALDSGDDGDRSLSKTPETQQTALEGRSNSSSNDADHRKVFLESFTAEEDKAIRRKVDRRFLWLIGMIYILKNVSKNLFSDFCAF
jgi:hypothetical protein